MSIRIEEEVWTFGTYYLPHMQSELAQWEDERQHLEQILMDIADTSMTTKVFVGGDANLDTLAAAATVAQPLSKVRPKQTW